MALAALDIPINVVEVPSPTAKGLKNDSSAANRCLPSRYVLTRQLVLLKFKPTFFSNKVRANLELKSIDLQCYYRRESGNVGESDREALPWKKRTRDLVVERTDCVLVPSIVHCWEWTFSCEHCGCSASDYLPLPCLTGHAEFCEVSPRLSTLMLKTNRT